jgi:CDP-6-deoxy-D-xylo-4-hexulose-3-dehydrase
MGVGGGCFTNDSKIAGRIRQYRDWGRQANTTEPHKVKELPKDYNPRFVYDKIGYNFQILELQAAMGRVQLKKSDKIKVARMKNFFYLYSRLMDFPDLILPEWLDDASVCWFSFPITTTGDRGKLVAHLEKHGIETRSMFSGNILKHPAYKGMKVKQFGKLEEANYILKHSFWITCHPRLKKSDLDYIIKVFKSYYARA